MCFIYHRVINQSTILYEFSKLDVTHGTVLYNSGDSRTAWNTGGPKVLFVDQKNNKV